MARIEATDSRPGGPGFAALSSGHHVAATPIPPLPRSGRNPVLAIVSPSSPRRGGRFFLRGGEDKRGASRFQLLPYPGRSFEPLVAKSYKEGVGWLEKTYLLSQSKNPLFTGLKTRETVIAGAFISEAPGGG